MVYLRAEGKHEPACGGRCLVPDVDGDNFSHVSAVLIFAPTLLCSGCTKLAEAIGEEDSLVGECRSCCTEESITAVGSYPRATLDICR